MSCESTDNELKLTKEYKYLLSYIRPLIDQLDKSRDAQLCLLWLSKLEQCASWEKNYRNKILTELCRQVKSNCLKPPFSAAPPSGPLRSIVWGDWKTRDWINNECSEVYATTEEVLSSSSHHSFNSPRNMHQRSPYWKGGGFCNSMKMKTSKTKDLLDHSECFAIQKAYHERAQNDQTVIERYQEIIKSLVSGQLKAEISPGRIKKLQAMYEVKLSELMHSLQREKQENEILKRKIECFEGDHNSLEVLKSKNEGLQKQVFELENEKSALEAKCKETDEEKLLSLSDLINKLNDTEKKLKESEKRCKSLEKKYEDGYREYESQLESVANEKEKLTLAKVNNLEKQLEEKEIEINGLREHFAQEISRLKQQLEETANCGRDKEKIKNLKNKTKKLEKIREHMTVLFQSQLQQILAKKDFYIASLEMQLKMNNSESFGNGYSSELNSSLDQKISNLEAQYRKLLEDSEQQSIKRRQLDLQKIHTLEKQLLSFGGVVVDVGEEDVADELELKNLVLASDTTVEVNPNAGRTT